MSNLSKLFGAQQADESTEAYITRLAERSSGLGTPFVAVAFRGLVDLYRRTNDLNARVKALEAAQSKPGM